MKLEDIERRWQAIEAERAKLCKQLDKLDVERAQLLPLRNKAIRDAAKTVRGHWGVEPIEALSLEDVADVVGGGE